MIYRLTSFCSLIWIFYIPLILWHEGRVYCLVSLIHRLASYGLMSLVLRLLSLILCSLTIFYWLMDGETQWMPDGISEITRAWHYVERTIDGKRTYGQLQFIGKHEGTAAKLPHVTGEGAGTLGKDHERHATLQSLTCLVV